MGSELTNKNLSSKSLTPLFLLVCYLLYLSGSFEYFLSKLFIIFPIVLTKPVFLNLLNLGKNLILKI